MSSYLIYIYLTFAREEEYVVHTIALSSFLLIVPTFSLVFVFFFVFFFFFFFRPVLQCPTKIGYLPYTLQSIIETYFYEVQISNKLIITTSSIGFHI